MGIPVVLALTLAAGLAAFLVIRALRSSHAGSSAPSEALLLEDAIITQPVSPGMEGGAEIRKRGAEPLAIRVRANDSARAFALGAMVRVIDIREGCCVIESADEEHLVR
jgi:hypothetical protein